MQKSKDFGPLGTKRKAGVNFATQVFHEFHQEKKKAAFEKPVVNKHLQSILNQMEKDASDRFNKSDTTNFKMESNNLKPIADLD